MWDDDYITEDEHKKNYNEMKTGVQVDINKSSALVSTLVEAY